jgi:sigma-B regulation protein RsbQ
MRRLRITVGALVFAALCACKPHPQASPDVTPVNPPAAAKAADPGEGPRIILSPDNVHIEYHVYGSGDPAVVLVHGWAADANYWREQIPVLKTRYTVVAINLAGHGASGANRSDWSIANYAQDVAAVVHEIPNPHVILVGHSMGATVALAATPVIGPRVIGVVVVEALRSVGTPNMSSSEIDRRVAPFSADFIGATRRLVSETLFQKGADPTFVQKVAYDMSLEPAAVGVASMRALLSYNLAALLPVIHVPVYGINSDLKATDAARIKEALPDFTLDVLAHSDHFLMMDDPARFNPLLQKDLAALEQRAAH